MSGYLRAFSVFLIAFGMAMTTACSNRQIYDNISANHRLKCERLPAAQVDECLAQNSQSYDEFKAEREASRNSE